MLDATNPNTMEEKRCSRTRTLPSGLCPQRYRSLKTRCLPFHTCANSLYLPTVMFLSKSGLKHTYHKTFCNSIIPKYIKDI